MGARSPCSCVARTSTAVQRQYTARYIKAWKDSILENRLWLEGPKKGAT